MKAVTIKGTCGSIYYIEKENNTNLDVEIDAPIKAREAQKYVKIAKFLYARM